MGGGLTILGDVYPDGVVVECVLVGIEALERVLVSRVVAVHGGIVLVAEDDAGAGYAFSRRLCALPAHGLLLVALELPLAAGEAVGWVRRRQDECRAGTHHPVRERMLVVGCGSGVWVCWSEGSQVHSLLARNVGMREHPHGSKSAGLYLYQHARGR